VPDCVGLDVPDLLAVVQAVALPHSVGEGEGELEADGEREGLGEAEGERLALPLREGVGDAEAETVVVGEEEGERDCEELLLCEAVAALLRVGVGVCAWAGRASSVPRAAR
jgi:hypothetical protein